MLYANGSVELADGNPEAALVFLRRASQVWQELGAPYEVASARSFGRCLGDRTQPSGARRASLRVRVTTGNAE